MPRNTKNNLILMLTSCILIGVGGWQVTHPALDLLIVPDAQQITFAQQFGQQTIRYTTANRSWRQVLAQRLHERRWQGRSSTSPYEPDNYYHTQRIWFISMTEMIAVRGTSTQADITIRRRILLFDLSIP